MSTITKQQLIHHVCNFYHSITMPYEMKAQNSLAFNLGTLTLTNRGELRWLRPVACVFSTDGSHTTHKSLQPWSDVGFLTAPSIFHMFKRRVIHIVT